MVYQRNWYAAFAHGLYILNYSVESSQTFRNLISHLEFFLTLGLIQAGAMLWVTPSLSPESDIGTMDKPAPVDKVSPLNLESIA